MKRILAPLLFLALAAPAWGHGFEKGRQAYERGDYPARLSALEAAAQPSHHGMIGEIALCGPTSRASVGASQQRSRLHLAEVQIAIDDNQWGTPCSTS